MTARAQLEDDWESVLERAVVTHGATHAIADNVSAAVGALRSLPPLEEEY